MNTKALPRMMDPLTIWLVMALLAGCGIPTARSETVTAATWDEFEAKVEYLRQQMKIPGLSAAVVMDQELVWAKGFGYADLENRIEATPDTPYDLASVTKTIAAVLIMQLVQEGVINLDDPVSKYGVELESQGTILVRHLLTHTSTGIPGTIFLYDGSRYNYLGRIVEKATGESFGKLLQERILEPLGMKNSWMDYKDCQIALGQSPYPVDWDGSEFQATKPYQLDRSYGIVEGISCEVGFGPAAGLISTVVDLAKFDIALDKNVLLKEESKENMFAPAISVYTDRPDLSHALGWFTQDYGDTPLIWHAGRCPPSVSANIIKAPEYNLTFIILANTDHLNEYAPLGDITYHTLALAFYETFVYPRQYEKRVPDMNWEAGEAELVNQLSQVTDPDLRKILERELWAYRQLFTSMGKRELANQLLKVYGEVFSEFSPSRLDLYTSIGTPVEYLTTLISDQIQLTDAERERLTGTYILNNQAKNESLPQEVRLQVNKGKIIASYEGGCLDLVSITPLQFTTPEQQYILSIHLNKEEVERVQLTGSGINAVYLPKK